jgi:hypothetical protein
VIALEQGSAKMSLVEAGVGVRGRKALEAIARAEAG